MSKKNKHKHNIYRNDSTWSTGDDAPVVIELAKSDADKLAKACAYMTQDVERVIQYLCKTIKVEWQMYLLGRKVTDDDILCDGYYIPRQKVTSASVVNLDVLDAEVVRDKGIIAIIHSHGNMQTFLSSTDLDTIGGAFVDYHMVVNNRYEYTAVRRYPLPKGNYIVLPIGVYAYSDDLAVEGINNIQHDVPVISGFQNRDKRHTVSYYQGNDLYKNRTDSNIDRGLSGLTFDSFDMLFIRSGIKHALRGPTQQAVNQV